LGPVDENLVKPGPPNAKAALGIRETRFDLELIIQKPDAPERRAIRGVELDAHPAQSRDPIGHKSFAASFIDGRARPVGDKNIKASLTSGKRGNQSRRAAANENDIRFRREPR